MIETIFEQFAELLPASVMANDSVKLPELETLTVTDDPVALPEILALPLMDQR